MTTQREVASLVRGKSSAVQEAARLLDAILADRPELQLKAGSSQVSIWCGAERLFRLKTLGAQADILVRARLTDRMRAMAGFDLVPHKNPDFLRFRSDNPSSVRLFLSAVRDVVEPLGNA